MTLTSTELLNNRPASHREFIRLVELRAMELRDIAGVSDNEPLDPRQLAESYGASILTLDDIDNVEASDRAWASSVSAKEWSGASFSLPDGNLLIILNANQTPERANVTIVEEIAHDYLGHRPSLVSRKVDHKSSLLSRTFDKATEDEAYWTAAAALLPGRTVAQAIFAGTPLTDLAAAYSVSLELVEFRVKVLNLWPKRTIRSS